MKKNKLVLAQIIMFAIILICTSVFATVNATIAVSADKTTLKRGDEVTVTLSLSGVESSKKVTSVEGYVNYNKAVFEDLKYASIVKNSDNKVTIGTESLLVEDVTNGANNGSFAFVGVNFDPASGNDTRIVMDFNDGVSSDTELLKIKFKVKSNATLGDIANAIEYKAFVITTGAESTSEKSAEITRTLNLKVVENGGSQDPDPSNPDPDPTPVTLSSISITTPPSKTAYKEGETFDKSGMVVTATYSDGSKKAVTGYSYSPTSALRTSDTAVRVTYTENGVTKTADQTISVSKQQEPTGKTLSSISITKAPNKTSYTAGENFDKTGMIVKAKYSDGTEKEITGYSYSPTSALTTNNNTITVSYTEGGVTKTANQSITVKAATNGGGTVNGNNTNKNNTNTNTNKNTVDTTTKTGALPATGAKIFIVPALILVALAYVSYVKYQKYKGI